LETRATKLQWEGQNESLIFLRDVTEQKHLKENLTYLSHHDPLTGLSNRSSWINHLKKTIENVSSSNTLIAVFALHIHRLVQINNTLGYSIGDFLLKEIANRLITFTQRSNDAARIGGDEFVILFSHPTRVEAISDTAQKVLARLCEPYSIESDAWGISVSIGIGLYPHDTRDPEALLENAQMALQHARKIGKNNYYYYSSTLEEQAKERLAVENNLRSALNQQDLFLLYQPIVSLATGQIVGMEALLRLRDEDMETLLPSQFIPIAEETGVIVRIGMWALLNACAQNKEWQEMGLPPLTMAVNLSAVQLKETNFISMVTRILHRTGLSPQYLELELTESMMQDAESALRVLRALKEIRILSSIDDFGTGYSSLSHLRQFPFTTLKIDISFVRNLMNREEDRSLVSTIITMAHNFRLRTIAEGVESLEQLQVLQSLGCDEVQGYFLSKPVSADEATKMLSKPPRFF
jgi:diguanylate cyclase (GGDEF)-like protein